jgi:septal ring factor EnvC (AmiA/AmiB activator)
MECNPCSSQGPFLSSQYQIWCLPPGYDIPILLRCALPSLLLFFSSPLLPYHTEQRGDTAKHKNILLLKTLHGAEEKLDILKKEVEILTGEAEKLRTENENFHLENANLKKEVGRLEREAQDLKEQIQGLKMETGEFFQILKSSDGSDSPNLSLSPEARDRIPFLESEIEFLRKEKSGWEDSLKELLGIISALGSEMEKIREEKQKLKDLVESKDEKKQAEGPKVTKEGGKADALEAREEVTKAKEEHQRFIKDTWARVSFVFRREGEEEEERRREQGRKRDKKNI